MHNSMGCFSRRWVVELTSMMVGHLEPGDDRIIKCKAGPSASCVSTDWPKKIPWNGNAEPLFLLPRRRMGPSRACWSPNSVSSGPAETGDHITYILVRRTSLHRCFALASDLISKKRSHQYPKGPPHRFLESQYHAHGAKKDTLVDAVPTAVPYLLIHVI